MYDKTKERLNTIIDEGYSFDFGGYIGQGFNIAQRNIGGFVLFCLLFFLIVVIVSVIPIIGSLVSSLVLQPCLIAGAYLVAHRINQNDDTIQFGDFFNGFQYVSQLVLTALVMNIIILVSLVPFIFLGGGKELFEWYMELMQNPTMMEEGATPPWEPSFLSILLLLPTLYLGVAYQWAYMFVIFYGFNFWDALEYSRRIITRNWFIVFAFSIVTGLIAAAGLLLLCIGILFTLPATWCMQYSAFAAVTLLSQEDDNVLNIEDHLF